MRKLLLSLVAIVFALPIFVFTSRNLEKYDIKKKKIYSMSLLLITLTFSIYNIRNFVRIQKESNNYYSGYNLLKSPYFYVPNVQVNTVYNKNGFKIYTPIKSMCWNAPTPCSYRKSVNIKEWKGYKVIQRKQD